MPINAERIGKLRQYGLSELSARTYLALLDLGVAEARDICALSRVPSSKVYGILEGLAEKGLVIIHPESPQRYEPIPIEEYLDRLRQEHLNAATTLQSERDLMAAIFSVAGTAGGAERGRFVILRGRRATLERLEEVVAATERELIVLATPSSAARSGPLIKALGAARDRGARLRFLLPLHAENLERYAALAEVAEVRARDLGNDARASGVTLVLSDEKRGLLIHHPVDDGNDSRGKDLGLYTDHGAIVSALGALVEPAWDRAPDYATYREDVQKGRLPEFTRLLTTQGQTHDALTGALRRGCREFLCAITMPLGHLSKEGYQIRHLIAASGADARVLLNLPDAGTLSEMLALSPPGPTEEIRHLSPDIITRFVILDDREALFSAGAPLAIGHFQEGVPLDAFPDLFVHTTNPVIVRGLRACFETLWPRGVPLEEHAAELEKRASDGVKG